MYICNCGKKFNHHMERTMHMGECEWYDDKNTENEKIKEALEILLSKGFTADMYEKWLEIIEKNKTAID